MPGGIICGYVSDYFGGRRACVVVIFQALLLPLLYIFAQVSEKLSIPTTVCILFVLGILIGGPNNIITSAVAADLADHPSINGNAKALGTVTGIINGVGSIIAAGGLLAVGPLTRIYGWSAVWYFMMVCTACGTFLMSRKVWKEIKGEGEDSAPAGGAPKAAEFKV